MGSNRHFQVGVTAVALLALAIGVPVASAQEKPAATKSRIDPQAQELFDKTIQALGGVAFLNAKSVDSRGRIFAISEGATAGFAPFESTVEFPDKRRFSYGKSKPVILLNDGERGWQLDRYGMIRQPDEQLRRWLISTRYGYENLLRRLIHEPDLLAQSAGTDFVENLPARVVEITDSRQAHIKLFVHANRYLPIRIDYRLLNAKTHEWDDYSEVYGDYREFQGIQTPRHETRYRNGERYSEVFRNGVEYNVEHPADYFTPGGGG